MDDPAQRLRAWLPHALLFGLLAVAAALLLVVVAPLADSLLLAGAVALLTYPILYAPVLGLLGRWFPGWPADQRRFTAAAAATACVALALAGTVLVVLLAVFGRLGPVFDFLIGLGFGDKARLYRALDLLAAKISGLLVGFPQLALDDRIIKDTLRDAFPNLSVGADVFSWLFKGTGGMVGRGALTLVALFYLYAQGPALAGLLMRHLPLTEAQREDLAARFRGLAISVVTGSVLRAAAHGVWCGFVAWLLVDVSALATGAVAAFLALLPVVGPGIAWLPAVSLAWTGGHRYQAVCLAVACTAGAWVIELSFQRLAQRLGAGSLWFGFLLFCGLVGGVASYGVRGLIIGPAAALTAAALFGFVPAVYGMARDGSR